MQYTRLTSPTALIDALKDIDSRLRGVENKGSGTISWVDDAGVETIIGDLPDGSVGIQPFVGDIEPPPVATAPSVATEPARFVVTWDGLFEAAALKPRDFQHVNVIGHKISSGVEIYTAPVGIIRLPLDSVSVGSDIAVAGEQWQFSLESEDYNGNKAAISTKSAVLTMLESSADASITEALNGLDTRIDNVIASSGGGSTITYSDNDPTTDGAAVGDTWFKRNLTNSIIAQWEWTGSVWVSQTISNEVVAGLDAGKIVSGELDAARIKAKSIEADKLVMSSTDNVVPEGDFKAQGISWRADGVSTPIDGVVYSIDATGSRSGSSAFKISNSATQQRVYNTTHIPVEAGSAYRVTVWYKADVAIPTDGIKTVCRTTNAAGATAVSVISSSTVSASASSTWWKLSQTVVIPSGSITAEFGFSSESAFSTGHVWFDNYAATRAGDATLIVDGAIDGKEITGATIQTASSGARVVLDDTGLYGYDADDINYLTADANGVTMHGTLVVNGETDTTPGSEVPLRAIVGNMPIGSLKNPDLTYQFVQAGIHFKLDGGDQEKVQPRITSPDGTILQLSSGMAGTSQSGNPYINLTPSQTLVKTFSGGQILLQHSSNTCQISMTNGGIGVTSINGFTVNGIDADTSTWQTLTLAGTWAAYTGGGAYYPGLRYRREGNTIRLQGMIKNAAATAPSTIGNLTVGFMSPEYSEFIPAVCGNAGTARSTAYLVISQSGAISYDTGLTNPTFVSINHTFPAA